jgi:hypothetical protein
VDILSFEVPIRSPADFTGLLRSVKRCMGEKTLRQIKLQNSMIDAIDIAELPETGPWPDYVAAHFEDADGKRYKLTVETYHGVGGSWIPL